MSECVGLNVPLDTL